MRIVIVYTEIQEAEDDPFEAKVESIILKSTVPYTHFHERYEFKLLFPESVEGGWRKKFLHNPKAASFIIIREVGKFLANATLRIKKETKK